tara:strand:- start:46784 stop:48877 length:2094 start_codon:yes stop_codon:yes gene_type:complete
MCGLAGTTDPVARPWAVAASLALVHRGPDGDGIWPEKDQPCPAKRDFDHPFDGLNPVLIHRRLATTDLDPRARQPMVSRDGRFVLVFNGYIAGYNRLRARLSPPFADCAHPGEVAPDTDKRSLADTEILLELLAQTLLRARAAGEAEAVADMLAGLSGAYAFALWDCARASLWLAVDGMGQKPLFVAPRADGHIFFASELSPLLSAPGIDLAPNTAAFDAALAHLFIPAPQTFFGSIAQLQPGEIMCWKNQRLSHHFGAGTRQKSNARQGRQGATSHLGSSTDMAFASRSFSRSGVDKQTVSAMRRLVYRAVVDAMSCDRPVACLVSGGMDSAGIAALACRAAQNRATSRALPTAIVMGFADQKTDETGRARRLADHLGLPLKVVAAPHDPEDLLYRLKAGLKAFGGPFANPSMILAHCLSQSVAEIAPVCLTGDGGDEIFGGYRRYQMAVRAASWRALPHFMRRGIGHVANGAMQCLPVGLIRSVAGPAKFLRAIGGNGRDVFNQWNNRCVLPGYGTLQRDARGMLGNGHDLASMMMLFDQSVTLPGNQLAMSDRMGMAFGVEYRPPLLGHAVRQMANALPVAQHLGGAGKDIWRAVVKPMVPAGHLDLRKIGFNPPVGQWVRDISMLLWGNEITAQKYLFARVPVRDAIRRKTWQMACANDFDAALTVWNLLVWQIWDGVKDEIPASGQGGWLSA